MSARSSLTWRSARTAEERAGLLAAAEELGNKTVAAEALDISRQHLHRLLDGRRGAATRAGRVTLSIQLERELAEWLDLEAVRLKHKNGTGKASKAEVVADLIREAMGRGERGR